MKQQTTKQKNTFKRVKQDQEIAKLSYIEE